MKKKIIYQITRHKISKIEITSEEEERAVAEANRDFERIDKRDKRYRLRNSSLEAMTEQQQLLFVGGFIIQNDFVGKCQRTVLFLRL